MCKRLLTLIIITFLYNFSLCQQCPNLPISIPVNEVDLENANRIIAECYAPTIHQMAEKNLIHSAEGRADFITSVFFDGNLNTGDNWENLSDYETGNTIEIDALDPVVYYSVVWTNYAWVITYGFYHPRDYTRHTGLCCMDNHENDFEGAIIVVSRETNNVIGGHSIAHSWLYSYLDITSIPTVYIDNRGHAVELNIGDNCIDDDFWGNCDNCMPFSLSNIIYTPSLTGEAFLDASNFPNPSNNLTGTGEYILEDIFGSHSTSLNNQRNNPLVFTPDNKFYGTIIDPNNVDCMDQSTASAPWGWSQFLYDEALIEEVVCLDLFGPIYCSFNFDFLYNTPVLIEHNPYFPNFCEQDFHISDVTVNADTEWDVPLGYPPIHKILIEPNVTLTVSNKIISMAPNGTIELQQGSSLILEGSRIESCLSEKWFGITTSPDASKVHILNGSEITEAKQGINIGPPVPFYPGPTPELLVANSTISNCDIGIRFGANNWNARIFDNSIFIDNEIGISAVRSRGVSITDSKFTNNTYGIDCFDTHMLLEKNNEFEGGTYGVNMKGTFPASSGLHIGVTTENSVNTFKDMVFGINCSGTEHPSATNIVNCQFENTQNFAAKFWGANEYTFANNYVLNSPTGTYSYSTGGNFNNVLCNEFEDNSNAGNLYLFRNNNSQFLENHSTGTQNINHALISAIVANNMGVPENPAANCFSENGFDIGTGQWPANNSGIAFNYHHYNDDQNSICEIPINPGDYFPIPTNTEGDYCFGNIGIFPFIDPDGDGQNSFLSGTDEDTDFTEHVSEDSVKILIQEWINNVISDGGDDPTTEVDETVYPQSYSAFESEQILDQWIRYAIYRGLMEQDFGFIDLVLNPLLKAKWRKLHYGCSLIQGDYVKAQSLLSAIPIRNQDDIYFNEVQQVNIKTFLGLGLGNTITQQEIDKLYIIANSEYPTSGYANSLYNLLTGIEVPNLVPDVNQYISGTTPRSQENEKNLYELTELSVFPNPVNKTISVSSNLLINSIDILDVKGKTIYQAELKSKEYEINTSDLNPGLYFLRVHNIEGVTTQRFVKR